MFAAGAGQRVHHRSDRHSRIVRRFPDGRDDAQGQRLRPHASLKSSRISRSIFLLPIFFAYTGLNTRIGVLNNAEMWFYCGLIIFVACLGKFGGSTLAARACGMRVARIVGAIGMLMNTRGLMELVILNVGRELGVITDAVFAMMVIMALVTTALTTPILHLVYPPKRMEEEPIADAQGGYSILIPVALPANGPAMLQLANTLAGADDPDRRILRCTATPRGA